MEPRLVPRTHNLQQQTRVRSCSVLAAAQTTNMFSSPRQTSSPPLRRCRPLLPCPVRPTPSAAPQHSLTIPRQGPTPCGLHYRAQRLLWRNVRLQLAALLRAVRPLRLSKPLPSAWLYSARPLLRLYGRKGRAVEEEGQFDGSGAGLVGRSRKLAIICLTRSSLVG
jgi:hypothetical protein